MLERTPARALHVVWVAQIISVALLVIVCGLVTRSGTSAAPELLRTLRPSFWIAAFVLTVVSIWWRRAVVSAHSAPHGAAAANAARARLQVSCFSVWALSELVAVLGLVLGVVAADLGEMLPFAGAAATLLYVHRPAVWRLGGSEVAA